MGRADFNLEADEISFVEVGAKVCCFFIVDQVAINASVADTTLATEGNGVGVVIGTEPDSY